MVGIPSDIPLGGSSTPRSSGSSGAGSERKKAKSWVTALKIIKFAIVVAISFIGYINIQPYVGMVYQLMGSIIDNSLVETILRIPIIGQLAQLVAAPIASLIGLAVWGIFQILEIMPHLLKHDPSLLNKAIGLIQGHKKVFVSATDSPFLKSLKRQYNELPQRHLKEATRKAWIAYAIDLLLCTIYFPPLKGGLQNIGLFFVAPSAADINWQNFMFIAFTLFAFEFFVGVWLWANNLQRQFTDKAKTNE